MLRRAKEKMPKIMAATERFEVPKVKGHVEGNKTIINNFLEICNMLRKEKEHLLKFLQRELATPAQIDGHRLVLGRKLASAQINSKIEQYVADFVLCPQCKRPDTQVLRENDVLVKKCTACGAKNPVRSKI